MLKKKTENQSIAEAALRCSVGSANAASTASGGSASIRARSLPAIPSQTPSSVAITRADRDVPAREPVPPLPKVHRASTHAGHVNQPICSPWRAT